MAKWSNDSGLDAALSWFADCDVLHLCKSQPATYAALASATIGSVSMTPGVGNGDFNLSDGDVSGRKLTVGVQDITAATASDAGSSLHVAIANTTDTTLRYVTVVAAQPITSGNPVQVGSWKIEIADPS